jgi:tRNA (cmo5U34)-methyltransferase
MNNESTSVGRFFDTLTDDYTATIERCFPRYREMLWALLDYLPATAAFDSILELGTGTGNLTVLLCERFPRATITAVDVSGDSLEVCQQRLGDRQQLDYRQEDFRDLSYADGSFDLVASSISVHHLTAEEKQQLFQQIYRWLKPGGVFAYVDQHAGATADLYQRHIDNWQRLSSAAGSTADEWEMWMQHQKQHDHHDTLADQMRWLSEAGFSVVDCPWRYLLWTVLQARK